MLEFWWQETSENSSDSLYSSVLQEVSYGPNCDCEQKESVASLDIDIRRVILNLGTTSKCGLIMLSYYYTTTTRTTTTTTILTFFLVVVLTYFLVVVKSLSSN